VKPLQERAFGRNVLLLPFGEVCPACSHWLWRHRLGFWVGTFRCAKCDQTLYVQGKSVSTASVIVAWPMLVLLACNALDHDLRKSAVVAGAALVLVARFLVIPYGTRVRLVVNDQIVD
jgi:hypothetical protein